MDWDEFSDWSKRIAEWGSQYHKTLRDRPVRAQTKPGEMGGCHKIPNRIIRSVAGVARARELEAHRHLVGFATMIKTAYAACVVVCSRHVIAGNLLVCRWTIVCACSQ